MAEGPKYRQIADDLRAAIDAGRYEPGDWLPGENALMAQYGVARMTARNALAVLRDEGLTVTKKGVGVRVRGFQPIYRDGIRRLSRDQWGSGRAIWDLDATDRKRSVDSIRIAEEAATRPVAAALDLPEDATVLVRRRRYLLDGQPVMLGVSSFPADIASGTALAEDNPGPGGALMRLTEMGHEPVHFREDVRARMPSADETAELVLEPATPVITIHRIAYTADGNPVEHTLMTLSSSVYVLRYEFDA